MTDLLKAPEAALRVGYKESTINRWCRTGKLPATKHGHHWFIRASDLEAMFDPFSPPSVQGAVSATAADKVLSPSQHPDGGPS